MTPEPQTQHQPTQKHPKHLQIQTSQLPILACYTLVFAGLWSLDDPTDPTTSAVIQDAVQNPDRYVLKPQREGGGNNLYGQDLVDQLKQGLAADGGKGLAAFILMQRIVPPPQRSVFVRGGEWQEDESLSELGIYGTFIKVGSEVSMTID